MLLSLPLQASLQFPLLAIPVIHTSASPHYMLFLKHTGSKAFIYLLFICVHLCVWGVCVPVWASVRYHRGKEMLDPVELEL